MSRLSCGEGRFGSAAVRAVKGAPPALIVWSAEFEPRPPTGEGRLQRRKAVAVAFGAGVGCDMSVTRNRPDPELRPRKTAPKTTGRSERSPRPDDADRRLDIDLVRRCASRLLRGRLATDCPAAEAAKSGMAFARRTGRGLVFLHRQPPEFRTTRRLSGDRNCASHKHQYLSLQSGCDSNHSASSSPRT